MLLVCGRGNGAATAMMGTLRWALVVGFLLAAAASPSAVDRGTEAGEKAAEALRENGALCREAMAMARTCRASNEQQAAPPGRATVALDLLLSPRGPRGGSQPSRDATEVSSSGLDLGEDQKTLLRQMGLPGNTFASQVCAFGEKIDGLFACEKENAEESVSQDQLQDLGRSRGKLRVAFANAQAAAKKESQRAVAMNKELQGKVNAAKDGKQAVEKSEAESKKQLTLSKKTETKLKEAKDIALQFQKKAEIFQKKAGTAQKAQEKTQELERKLKETKSNLHEREEKLGPRKGSRPTPAPTPGGLMGAMRDEDLHPIEDDRETYLDLVEEAEGESARAVQHQKHIEELTSKANEASQLLLDALNNSAPTPQPTARPTAQATRPRVQCTAATPEDRQRLCKQNSGYGWWDEDKGSWAQGQASSCKPSGFTGLTERSEAIQVKHPCCEKSKANKWCKKDTRKCSEIASAIIQKESQGTGGARRAVLSTAAANGCAISTSEDLVCWGRKQFVNGFDPETDASYDPTDRPGNAKAEDRVQSCGVFMAMDQRNCYRWTKPPVGKFIDVALAEVNWAGGHDGAQNSADQPTVPDTRVWHHQGPSWKLGWRLEVLGRSQLEASG